MENLAVRFIRADYPAGDTAPVTDAVDLDNLKGHYTPELVLWLFAHGVMVLYTHWLVPG